MASFFKTGFALDEILTNSTRFWIEDGIVKSRPLRPVVLTGEYALESVRAMETLAAGRKLPRLAFLDGLQYVERAAREMYVEDRRSLDSIEAMALVAESEEAKSIARFVVEATAQPYPVAVFEDEASALAWLRSGPAIDSEG